MYSLVSGWPSGTHPSTLSLHFLKWRRKKLLWEHHGLSHLNPMQSAMPKVKEEREGADGKKKKKGRKIKQTNTQKAKQTTKAKKQTTTSNASNLGRATTIHLTICSDWWKSEGLEGMSSWRSAFQHKLSCVSSTLSTSLLYSTLLAWLRNGKGGGESSVTCIESVQWGVAVPQSKYTPLCSPQAVPQLPQHPSSPPQLCTAASGSSAKDISLVLVWSEVIAEGTVMGTRTVGHTGLPGQADTSTDNFCLKMNRPGLDGALSNLV